MKLETQRRITSFQPPVRILMGPGPSDVHPRVLEAMARPTIGHLAPAFVHAETSTGVQSDAKTLAALAHEHGALTIVDAVTKRARPSARAGSWISPWCSATGPPPSAPIITPRPSTRSTA